jgi:serine/threonine protein kinase/tetratricopeptide (TPR) repeat protein
VIGTSLSHYRITAALGAGGMGEVYRATDTKLGREVAIKVLPAGLAGDPDRLARFEREARAIAALNHPQIVTIYSVEEADGVHFLTMELVEGQPLDRVIPAGGMPVERLLEIGAALAEALAAAHEKGIVHRDLKPGNVMLTDSGRLKVLDFGLAKVAAAARPGESSTELPTEARTSEGVVMGTAPYMSPEQAAGRDVDHRSDIFSLGVMLFELATGARPFQGASNVELLSSILKDPTPDLARVKPGLPPHLSRLIARCLEKAPADRYPTARAVLEELPSVAGAPPAKVSSGATAAATRERSIAVLPFVNRGGNPEEDYFSDGLSEELINALGALRGLKVTARSSSFQFRGQELDVREIGRRLGVAAVLEGSVRMARDRLRITVELVSAEDGYQIWSQRYDGEMKDVFDTQDEIVAKVVEALRVPLGVGATEPAREPHVPDVEAYHLYLKGLHLRVNRLDLRGALAYFRQAVERDPSFAAAHVGVAEVQAILCAYTTLPPREGIAAARQSLERARALGGESAEQLYVEALIALSFDWDSRTGLELLRRAVEQNPSHSPARMWCALAYALQGRPAEAHEQLRIGQERDPLSSYVRGLSAMVLLQLDEGEDACAAGQQAVEFEPSSLLAVWTFGLSLAACSRWEEALVQLDRAVQISGEQPFFLGLHGWAEAASGRRDRALQTRARLGELATKGYVSPSLYAYISSELGEMDEAREKLKAGFDERSGLFVFSGWPFQRRLRHEPLMQRLSRHLVAADGSVFTP